MNQELDINEELTNDIQYFTRIRDELLITLNTLGDLKNKRDDIIFEISQIRAKIDRILKTDKILNNRSIRRLSCSEKELEQITSLPQKYKFQTRRFRR